LSAGGLVGAGEVPVGGGAPGTALSELPGTALFGGCAGVAFAPAGAPEGNCVAGTFSRTELDGPDDITESTRDVNMNTTAETVVILERNVEAPRAPNAVWDEPPKAAATSAPFPVWRRTTRIRKRQTKT
jgi:hypothetical protein